jgi:PAS domain S-box-containing protein
LAADQNHTPRADDSEGPTLDRLRAREALLSEAEHIVRLGSYVWEPRKSTLWSDEFYRIIGCEPGTVQPSADVFFGAVHPDDRADVRAAAVSTATLGIMPDIEFRVIRRDNGEMRHIRGSGCVYRAEDGSVQRIVGALLDITESKRAALALEQSLAVSRAAEELAQAGSFVIRLEPLEITLSDGLRRLTGLPAHPARGGGDDGTLDPKLGLALLYPDDRVRILGWWKRLLEAGSVEAIQIRIQHQDGTTRHLHARATVMPFLCDGGKRVVGSALDISARVEMEQDLQRAAKLEAVGTLAAGIAHDFNNYLLVVGSALELVTRAEVETRQQLIKNAQRAVTRCAELTRQLLGFARRQPFAPELIDVCAVVEAMHELFRQSLGRRAQLRVDTPGAALFAHVDARHLEQMLANLIVNAADAIETSGRGLGEVNIIADQLHLMAAVSGTPDSVSAGHFTRIRVEDDGGGVAPEFLPRIFEPYFTTKPRGRGTGLGLSAVYGMAHQNGGVVTVDALPAGTRFALWFPVPEQRVAPPPRRSAHPDARAPRILVVDDVPELRFATALSLRAAGFETLEASGAETALAELASREVDVVLSDIQMPGIDGYALAAEIAKCHPGLPVVLMTGYARAAAEHDVPSYRLLHKPFSEAALLAAVQSALA